MKFSHYFLKTSKTIASDEKSISSQLLKRAGFIQESVAGRYYFLPMGHRVQQKIMSVIKKHMDAAGAQEMITPILHPLELWKETSRTDTTGFELMKVKDRRGAEFALGGTAEEMFVDLVRHYTVSYRDLPFHLYQFSPKFRDELRARGGLLRVREFIMKDGYSFHADEKDFRREYEVMKRVYTDIFNELGLTTYIVESDNGYIGGEYCHEFIVESDIGESTFFMTEDGTYAAHEDVARFEKHEKNLHEKLKAINEVEAVRGVTMEEGVKHHRKPLWQQIKDVMYVDEKGRFVLAIIRGDLEVNEVKLQHCASSTTLRPASEDEIRNMLGSEPGFISPVGIKSTLKKGTKLVIVADDSLRTIVNAYGGGNAQHRDLMNVNIDRDYQPDIEGDIALAKEGYEALDGKGKLILKRGIEVGNIFQLGHHYSKRMKGAVFIDADGKEQPFYMGCYGIGLGRSMAAIVEKYHDEHGMTWPSSVAPFQAHLIALSGASSASDEVYEVLVKNGIEVLYDDRDVSAGEKFADADLIGLPIRLVISKKTMDDKSIEVKMRTEKKALIVTLKAFLDTVKKGKGISNVK